MVKVNIAITVDSWVANWLNEQPEKRSSLINQIMKDHITATKPRQKRIYPTNDWIGSTEEEHNKRMEEAKEQRRQGE